MPTEPTNKDVTLTATTTLTGHTIQYKKVIVEQQVVSLKFSNGTSISGSFNGSNEDAKTVSDLTEGDLPAGATVTYILSARGNTWGSGASKITYAETEYTDSIDKGSLATGTWTNSIGEKSFTTKTAGTLVLSGGCGGATASGSSTTGVGASGFGASVIKIEINGVEATIE